MVLLLVTAVTELAGSLMTCSSHPNLSAFLLRGMQGSTQSAPFSSLTDCRYSFPGLSWNSLCGKFMIFTTDAEISRRVFSYNDPETLLMAVHPSGKNILGEGNLAFMHGPPHKAIRKSFLSLFTRKALATYVELQDGIIRDHLKQWQKVEGEREIRLFVRCAQLKWPCCSLAVTPT